MSTGHAATLQAVAAACQDPRLAALAEAVGAGTLTLPKAAALARFHAGAAPVADPAQLDADTAILIEAAPRLGERQLAVAIRHATALLRPERDAEHLEERRRAARALHKGPGPAGMATYRLVLDPEGAAILDAAIDPLARPNPAAGAPDLRTPAARRAEALLTVIGRGVSSPGQAPKTAKTTLVVTLSLETLTGQLLGAPGGVGTAGAPTRCRTCGTTPTTLRARPSGAALTLGQELLTPATRAPPGLRGRPHPRRPGHRLRGPRPRPHPPPGPTRAAPRRLAARRRLHLARLHRPGPVVRRPPRHPLVARRPHLPGQHRPALRTPPHPGPRARPDPHHHRHHRHLAPLTPPPHTPPPTAGPSPCARSRGADAKQAGA